MFLKKMDLNKCFDEFMVPEIIKFSNKINESKADILVLMARKAAVFFQVLVELGYIKRNVLNKTIITDRVYDQSNINLQGKKIAIIDDVIISGSTIAMFLKKLHSLGCEYSDIDIYVLAINSSTEKMKFKDPHTGYDILDKKKCLQLSDVECTKLCGDISRALSLLGKPYDIDFPSYHKVYLNKSAYDKLLLFIDWKVYDVSNHYHINADINSITLIPPKNILDKFFKYINYDLSNLINFKIRMYVYKNNDEVIMKFVPMAMINELDYATVEKIFNFIVVNNTFVNSRLESITSKVKLIQFYFAYHLMNYFAEQNNLQLHMHDYSIKYLFGITLCDEIYNIINTKSNVYVDMSTDYSYIAPETLDYNKKICCEEKCDTYDINEKLFEPFIYWYKKKEQDARESMKCSEFNFINVERYTKNIKRLNEGFSINFFKNLVKELQNKYKIEDMVSVFIDRSIDMGVIVPILYNQQSRNIIVRAFRHGEDIPFEESDKNRLLYFIEQFLAILNKANQKISRMNFQFILTLFFRFAVSNQRNIFNCFLGFDNEQVLSISYLNGKPIPTIIEKKINSKQIQELNILFEKKEYIEWLITKLINEDIITTDIDDNIILNHIDTQFIQKGIANKVQSLINIYVELLSSWYNSYTEKTLFKENISILLSCDTFDHKLASLMSILNACVINTSRNIVVENFENITQKEIDNINNYFANTYKNSTINETLNYFFASLSWYEDKNVFLETKEKVRDLLDLISPIEAYLWDHEWESIVNINETVIRENIELLEKVIYNIMRFHIIYYKLAEINESTNNKYSIDYIINEYMSFIDKFKVYNPKTKDLRKFYENKSIEELINNIPYKTSVDHISEFKSQEGVKSKVIFSSVIVIDAKEDLEKTYGEIRSICCNYDNEVVPFYLNSKINRIVIGIRNYNFKENLDIFKNISQCLQKFKITWRSLMMYELPKNLRLEVPIIQDKIDRLNAYNDRVICRILNRYMISNFNGDIIYLYPQKYDNDSNYMSLCSNIREIDSGPEKNKEYKIINIGAEEYCMVHFYKNRKKVAIITVIDEETKAVIDEFDLKKINNEDINLKSSRIFYGGNLETSNGGIELYQSTCLNQGNVAAAELTRAIQQLIKPDLYVLLGVAGSLNEHELEECDVIIAKQVFDGQTVKETETDNKYEIFTYSINPIINTRIQDFMMLNHFNKFKASDHSKHESFKVKYANICDNGHLIVNKESEFIKKALDTNRKVYAIEMEASGASEVTRNEELDTEHRSDGIIIIRGISDIVKNFNNKPSDNKWHYSAARNAAIVLKKLLQENW